MPFVPDDTATVDAPAPPAGRFVPDAPAPVAPRTGAAAIPTADEAAGKPYTPPAAMPPKPVYGITDQIKGVVEAGINTATGVVGALIGGVTGMGQSIAENTGMMAPSGTPQGQLPSAAGPRVPISLDESMGRHAEGITGALKRTVSGPMDLREAQAPDSELGQQYTEALQPVMETMFASAPLHGTMGPKGGVKAASDAVRRAAGASPEAAAATAAAGVVKKGAISAARKVASVDPELAKVAQLAGEQKYPIDVRPDQIIEGAKFTKLAGQAASDVPLSGSKKNSNQVAYTRNLIDLLNPDEVKADRLTPEVFDQAMTRSGEGIGDITARTPVPESELMPGLNGVDLSKATPDNAKIANAYIADIQKAAQDGGGTINGTQLKEINSQIGQQARSNAGNDLGRYLSDLQDVIQDAVEHNAKPEDIQPLRDFRRQYAYGKMVEPLVAKTIDGKVSPAGLMARVTATKQGKHYMARAMGGPIGDLAKVGQLIKEPGSSGTAERGLVYGVGLGGGAYVEPHTAAAVYGSAAAYNIFGPKLTRALVGERAKPKGPPGAPPEPGTTLGAADEDHPPPPGPPPGPLGDLTPDWQTTPGAGGGAARGGEEPGLVPSVGEKGITRFVPGSDPRQRRTVTPEGPQQPGPVAEPKTPAKRAGSEIPAVPGRPDVPDSMLTGRPKEIAGTERANEAMQEPGTQEALRQQRLRAEEAARKEIPVGEAREVSPGEGVGEPKTPKSIPVGKATEGQPEIKTKTPDKIPEGKATEITPEHIALGEEPIPVGEATHLTPELVEVDKKWRTDHKLGEDDAGRARDVVRALGLDEKAVEAAAKQHENSPRAFDREIARITEEGQARENESKQAAGSSPSNAEGTRAVRQVEANDKPAAAVRAAGDEPGADRTATAGTERSGAEPADRQETVKRVRAATEPISHDEALKLVSGKTEKSGGVDPARMLGASVDNGRELRHGDVPLDAIRANEEGVRYDGTVDLRRATEYAERGGEMPPVLLVEGRDGNFNVNDGGHRVTAARLRGDETIPAIVGMRSEPAVGADAAVKAKETDAQRLQRIQDTPRSQRSAEDVKWAKSLPPVKTKAFTGKEGDTAPSKTTVARDAAKTNGVEIHEVPGGFEARRGDTKVGYLKDNLERGQAKQLGESANVDMVKVDKGEEGQGTGRALYEAFNEKHEGAILPSGKTEPSAWKLWKRNYPDKVDQFVKEEAARIKDGADEKLVIGNITDPEVAQRVQKEVSRGPDPKPDNQPGAVQQEAGQKDVSKDGDTGAKEAAQKPAEEGTLKSAAALADEMADLRKTQPRPLAKLFGTKGPTPEQKIVYDAKVREWNSKYRKLSAAQKEALARDNAAYRAAPPKAPK